MPEAIAVVIYSDADENSTFDLEYYEKTHMPLVKEHWGPMGLKSYTVAHFTHGLGGSKPPFRVQATLYFESEEAITTAVTSEAAKTVFADVPKFTNISPQFAGGDIVFSG